MEFGPVPLGEAEGAILAHSLEAGGARLRKGRVLAAADLERLAAAGVDEVVVARLGPDDADEDVAAVAVARALVPDEAAAGLRLGAAATGRVNIHAEGPGVLEVDAAAVHALNAADPMITLAVLPPFARVGPRALVATVKVIAYGVPRASVAAAVAAAGSGALRLRPPVLRTASFIETVIGEGAGGKGEAATRARLEALGVELLEAVRVPHAEAPLAEAVAAARGEVVLILTASATSDPRDVAPAAVRRAGGSVARFGMPVDPGNLLFVGDVEGRAVIGLPGCARSPALNGADFVLERIVCGLPVGDAEIAAMGVGGLLKESPARPSPREKRRP